MEGRGKGGKKREGKGKRGRERREGKREGKEGGMLVGVW